jgi:O-antigen ligase
MNFSELTNKEKLFNYTILLVSIFPILGLKISVSIIFLFGFFSIYIFFSEKNYTYVTKTDLKNVFVLTSFYLALLISCLFTTDKLITLKLLEQNSSFLIFPLFLILNRRFIHSSTLSLSLTFFVLSNVCLAIYVWLNIYHYGISKAFNENTYYYPILRLYFSRLTGIHLPYLGMLFVFSSLIIVNRLLKSEKGITIKKTIEILFLLFLLISVFTFAARQSIVSFLLISSFLIFFNLISNLKKTVYFSAVVVISIPLFSIPSVQNRIKEFTEAKLILPSKDQNSDQVNFRYGIYNCTLKLIQEHWKSGVGAENVQKKLNECYSSYTYKGFDDFQHKTYNTHNQFFDILLKFGVFGFLCFFVYLFWGIKLKSDYYYIFIALSILCMLTENILDRQIGIVFFNFFNSLFFVQNLNKKNIKKV